MGIEERWSEKGQNVRLLYSELRIKTRRNFRYAPIGILGCEQTGKKTLAYRLGAMDQGPFEDKIESRYYYRTLIDLDSRPYTGGSGDVYLKSYIVPPPSDLPTVIPPIYENESEDFPVLVFVCSVTNRASFTYVTYRLEAIRQAIYPERFPFFLIVGNKKDLNRSIYQPHVTFGDALFTAHELEASYLECSAKENTEVDIILDQILIKVIAEQP